MRSSIRGNSTFWWTTRATTTICSGRPIHRSPRVDHAIGVYASALVRDGGTLQIGIGELGDALAYALLLRHQQNLVWSEALAALGPAASDALIGAEGGREPFTAGVFASTEMFVDQLLELYRAGVVRRRAYDSLALEKLLAAGEIAERFDAGILGRLAALGLGPVLSEAQFSELRRHGVFREETEYAGGRMRARGGPWIRADLGDPESRDLVAAHCLGRELRNGQVLHAGFFLGPRGFYAALRELPESDRAQFGMRGVGYINQLYGPDQELRVLQRRAARFVNNAMMVTLLGAAVSDALENGQVVSGVGGQYNFVAMAHALPDARSILCVRATRTHRGVTTSNIVWSYGHETVPRHLRDIVVTEYGIADLRGRTDEEIIMALLDSRRLALPGRAPGARPRRRQDPRRLPHPRRAPRQYAGAPRARLRTAPRARLLQRIPVRHRSHRGRDPVGARAEVSGGAHRHSGCAARNRRSGAARRWLRAAPPRTAPTHGTRSAAGNGRAAVAAPLGDGARRDGLKRRVASACGPGGGALGRRACCAGLLSCAASAGSSCARSWRARSCGAWRAWLVKPRRACARRAAGPAPRPSVPPWTSRYRRRAAARVSPGFSSVETSWVISSPRATERSSRRMILPERVLGRLSAKRMSSGLAIAPSCSPTQSRSSRTSAAVSPVGRGPRSTTKANTDSPLMSCGLPTTAASATRGCATSADSISMVPSRCPATFSTSSMRPMIQK